MSRTLPPTSLQILSLSPPTPSNPSTLSITLRPANASTFDPSMSLSFCFKNQGHEIFIERTTFRELQMNGDGSVGVTLTEVPRRKDESTVTEVVMHVWQGEKWLGDWEVGRY